MKSLVSFLIVTTLIFFNSPWHICTIFMRIAAVKNVETAPLITEGSLSKLKDAVNYAIPYYHDFRVYQVACYIPDIGDVYHKGAGDCKARTILYSSLLKARNIKHTVMYSMVHWWIDFKDREYDSWEKKYENSNDALWSQEHGVNWEKLNRNIEIIFDNLGLYRRMMYDEMPTGKRIFYTIFLFMLIFSVFRGQTSAAEK